MIANIHVIKEIFVLHAPDEELEYLQS